MVPMVGSAEKIGLIAAALGAPPQSESAALVVVEQTVPAARRHVGRWIVGGTMFMLAFMLSAFLVLEWGAERVAALPPEHQAKQVFCLFSRAVAFFRAADDPYQARAHCMD